LSSNFFSAGAQLHPLPQAEKLCLFTFGMGLGSGGVLIL